MIAHLDVDCFFAQVEEVRLGVGGRPLGVQQNMEIAAVNYEACEFGLFNRVSVEEGCSIAYLWRRACESALIWSLFAAITESTPCNDIGVLAKLCCAV